MIQNDVLKILKAGKNVYVTGPAGSGKTHALREYIEHLRHHGVGVALTATTGIAATHIGGVTIHSWSGIGIKDYLSDHHIQEIAGKEYLAKRYKNTEVLIIDEVSMLSAEMFDSIERLARHMKGNFEPFGGMQIVLSGDFFQLPPIAREGKQVSFINRSQAWNNSDIRICYLETQFRQEDDNLESLLSEIRSGEVSELTFETLQERQGVEPDENITKLFTHNKDVDSLNDKQLDLIEGVAHEFYMESKGKKNLVENIKKGLLAPEVLRLKKGAAVMFIKNNFEEGYVNGTLGTVIDFKDDQPIVETRDGKEIRVESAEWKVEEEGKTLAIVKQFPLRLAWAITVHKSQGMSLDAAEIDLSKSFVPGQGYVALSRLRTLDGLFLRGINNTALQMDEYILEFDNHLKKESQKWRQVIERFSDKDMTEMHNEFVLKKGGTLDPDKIKENKENVSKGFVDKIPTQVITLGLLQKNMNLREIAKERGMTVGTIISHLEKLKENGEELKYFKKIVPKKKDLDKISKAFEESKDGKLTPIHRKLKSVYDFDTLKLVRLFI
jgi:ATP-dependent exoDNAse (exonuclease V) alpha subunit